MSDLSRPLVSPRCQRRERTRAPTAPPLAEIPAGVSEQALVWAVWYVAILLAPQPPERRRAGKEYTQTAWVYITRRAKRLRGPLGDIEDPDRLRICS